MLPSFQTDRLILRPRGLADLAASLDMDRDPEVTRFIPGPWHDPVRHEAFVRQRIETVYGDGLGYWSILAKTAPQHFAGWVLLIPQDAVGPDIEIGWRLRRSSWGQGYATEAVAPVLRHAFGRLGLARVIADIDPGNRPSRRVAEKIGMEALGRTEHDGQSAIRYVMTRHDYPAQKDA